MYSPQIYAALAEASRRGFLEHPARPRPARSARPSRRRRRLPRVIVSLRALRARS